MRVVWRALWSAAMLAALALALAPGVRAQDDDPATANWVKTAGWRLDRVLEPAPYGERAAGAFAELRIAEATLLIDEAGSIKSWALTRSTGRPRTDQALIDAAEHLATIDLPPPPPGVVGRPIVLRVSFVTPPRVGPRSTEQQRGPTVLIEPSIPLGEATPGGPAPVVISAVR